MSISVHDCTILKYDSSSHQSSFTCPTGNISGEVYIIVLTAGLKNRQLVAVGEVACAQALNKRQKQRMWSFLSRTADLTNGIKLSADSVEKCLASIHAHLDRVQEMVETVFSAGNPVVQVNELYAGIEVALLDLAAQAFEMSIAGFLGGHDEKVGVTVKSILADDLSCEEMKTLFVDRGKQYPVWRFTGKRRIEDNLNYLREMTRMTCEIREKQTFWVSLNQQLSLEEARSFIYLLAHEDDTGKIKGKIILEQPTPKAEYGALHMLQRTADEVCREGLKVVIMAGDSVQTLEDWHKLQEAGGCGAINITSSLAGGLLSSLATVRAVSSFNSTIEIALDGERSISDLSAWSYIQLARCIPGLKYFALRTNEKRRLNYATVPLRLEDNGDIVVVGSPSHGLGSGVDFALLASLIDNVYPESTEFLRNVTTLTEDNKFRNTYNWPEAEYFRHRAFESFLLEVEVLARQMNTRRLSPLLFLANNPAVPDKKEIGFWWSASNYTSVLGLKIYAQKQLTRALLQSYGIPVPQGRKFMVGQTAEALQYAERLGWPVVVKPSAGTGGRGVTTNISSLQELSTAIESVKSFIVEEHIRGNDYRILATDEKVLAVFTLQSARVIGDGKSTIRDLVDAANRERLSNPRYRNSLIKPASRAAKRMLELQAMTVKTIPEKGLVVSLSSAANITQGGEGMVVTAETHPSIIALALRVCRIIPGLSHVGIDVLMEDHRQAVDQQVVKICEINTHAAFSALHFPLEGRYVNAAGELLLYNARRADVKLGEKLMIISVKVVVHGLNNTQDYFIWLQKIAGDLGVMLEDVHTEMYRISYVVTGWVHRVACITALSIRPKPGIKADMVMTETKTLN